MTEKYLPVYGQQINPDSLNIPKAKLLAKAIIDLNSPYVQLVECRRLTGASGSESVVFDVKVEIGQQVVHDIKDTERICAAFNLTDDNYPEVSALRQDFPTNVPHKNLREYQRPVSLCLYEEPYHEVKLDWTPVEFIERIRNWLALTSRNELHAPDQPLEPIFFPSYDKIIIPHDLFADDNFKKPVTLCIQAIKGVNKETTLIANRMELEQPQSGNQLHGIATIFACPPLTHGIITHQPKTLNELHSYCISVGLDLLNGLRSKIKQWYSEKETAKVWDKVLILLIAFPKTRDANGHIEVTDIWGFHFVDSLQMVGEKIGVLEKGPNGIGLSIPIDETKSGEDLSLVLLTPIQSFSRSMAAKLNGSHLFKDLKISLIGLGALGSQVFMNLVRSGIGQWFIIDNDVLLPHNLARHYLFPEAVGHPKVDVLAYIANSFYDSELPTATAIKCDVLKSEQNKTVMDALSESDVIIDSSVSPAVARFFARDVDAVTKRISIFLSPSGKDLVVLAEPKDRSIKSDYIEMQYYRTIMHQPILTDHLSFESGDLRYGNTCRDISSVISQNAVAAHSAIASATIKKLLDNDLAFGAIWSNQGDFTTIQMHPIDIFNVTELEIGDWLICFDEWFIERIYVFREEKLPNETGGVLIGSYDSQRNIIYVVDTIESPPDSTEWPSVYIRGCRGLGKKIELFQKNTLNRLRYVGEWHSHGTGVGCQPSLNDKKAYKWLSESMRADGLPPLMLIAGDKMRWQFYMGAM